MAQLVKEIMNTEMFTARSTDRVEDLVGYYRLLGIGACPVMADDGALLGMISLRDLISAQPRTAFDHMSRPVITVDEDSSIEKAAVLMGESSCHRLPVVDSSGSLVGIVSSLDVIRGLVGIPARHPDAFRHVDETTTLSWSGDTPLEYDRVEAASEDTGVLAIVHGGVGQRERVVWVEMPANMRARLLELLSQPQEQHASLRAWLENGPLLFRTAEIPDRSTGQLVVDILQRRAGHAQM